MDTSGDVRTNGADDDDGKGKVAAEVVKAEEVWWMVCLQQVAYCFLAFIVV